MLFTGAFSYLLSGRLGVPGSYSLILVASSGASVMLIFILPSSPVSQPYNVIMSHLISAAIGVACADLPLPMFVNAALCVTLCVAAMFLLKCIHPPGGATAMMPIIVGSEAVGGYGFVFYPVLCNMACLLLLGYVFHRYFLEQNYPVTARPKKDEDHQQTDSSPLARLGIGNDDMEAALKQFNAYLNVSKEDLAQVFGLAQQNVYHRKFGEIRCQDIMSEDVKFVYGHTELEEAWALLRLHKIKLLPVVDSQQQPIGVISLVDFLKRADLKSYIGFGERLGNFVRQDPKMIEGRQPRRVADIMTSPAYTVERQTLIAGLVPLLSDKGFHHIPIVDAAGVLSGMVTQSDLIAALYTGAVADG